MTEALDIDSWVRAVVASSWKHSQDEQLANWLQCHRCYGLMAGSGESPLWSAQIVELLSQVRLENTATGPWEEAKPIVEMWWSGQENLDLGIHIDAPVIHTICLHIVADYLHPFMGIVFPGCSGLFLAGYFTALKECFKNSLSEVEGVESSCPFSISKCNGASAECAGITSPCSKESCFGSRGWTCLMLLLCTDCLDFELWSVFIRQIQVFFLSNFIYVLQGILGSSDNMHPLLWTSFFLYTHHFYNRHKKFYIKLVFLETNAYQLTTWDQKSGSQIGPLEEGYVTQQWACSPS